MSLDLELTVDTGREIVTLDWTIESFTGAPDGKFLFVDDDGEPRLILDEEELVQLQRGEQ